VYLNPELPSNVLGSGGGEDFTMDVDAELLETFVLKAAALSVKEAFRQSMVLAVTQTPAMPMLGKSSKIAGVTKDLVHLERPAKVVVSRYFLVLEIQNFLLHKKFAVVGFSKERPKFNIQL
jgi:hypothetical protein